MRQAMRRDELETWLCGSRGPAELTAMEVAILTGGEQGSLTPLTARSIRFVLAVLRDLHDDETEVWRWLFSPKRELNGARAVDLIPYRTGQVEELVVREWNRVHGSGVRRRTSAAQR